MYKKFSFLIYATAISFLFLTQMSDYRAFAETKESCITTSCHATMGKEKFVHGPVAAGECTSCHVQKGKHKFKPITKVGQLCEQCHEPMNVKKVVHPR